MNSIVIETFKTGSMSLTFFFVLTLSCTLVLSEFEDMASSNSRENIFHHVSISTNKFSREFYSNVAPKFNDNVVCSPLSAHVILSLVAYGAREKTWRELKSGLHLPDDNSIAQNEFRSLLDTLNNPTEIELNLANAIYVQENISLVPDFVSISSKFFNSDTTRADFQNSAASVKDINSWVEERTKNRIKDVICADDIDESTKIVLVNAIYFKGAWKHKFKTELTENRPFFVTRNEIKNIPTMFKKFKYPHGEVADLNARIIELPYSNQDFSMLILLPNEIDGLRHVEVNFNRESIENVEWKSNEIQLFLPKFKVQSTIHLKETLQEMRMSTMFSDLANLSAMAPNPLKISNVIQKAFVEVNEEGSEAAAATVVGIRMKRMADPPETFKVDRPFMFIIQHKPSNIPMFVGSIRILQELIGRDEL